MVIISAINVPWALKINLTEERKLLVNMAVIINFENNLKATKPKKKKQQKSMTEDYVYMQAKVHHSVFLKLFNGLWTIRARYLQKETAGDILRSVQIRYTEYNEQFKEMDKDQSGAGQNAFQFTFISKVIMHWKWILIFGAIERSKHWFFFSNVLDSFTLSFELGDNGYTILYKLVWRIRDINKTSRCFNSGSHGRRLDSHATMSGNWRCVTMVGTCIQTEAWPFAWH